LKNSDRPISVYFLGSDAVALPVLKELLERPEIEVVGIGAQPDRPAGRRRQLRPTAVAEFAQSAGLAVDKPESVNAASFVEHLARIAPDLIVVMAFGQILKPDVLNLPPLGCLNVHLSLLPRHRGAAPVAAAILAGDEETGVSFMRMDEGLDTGPVYMQVREPVRPDDTAGALEERLSLLAARHITPCIVGIAEGRLRPKPQNPQEATIARKIKKSDALLDFAGGPADYLERMVRAYNPWPRAWFMAEVNGRARRIQVLRAAVVSGDASTPPGHVISAPDRLDIQCVDGAALRILELVPEGQHSMPADAFLRGCRSPLKVLPPSPDGKS